MSNTIKDTIYIDVDDEITAIIDKVQTSPRKIVALVLPKRALALQSIVNMKLLKRTATETKKNVVLITSEAGLMPLAGAVGLHVAKSLESRPAVPPPPDKPDSTETVIEDAELADNEVPPLDGSKPVGELAGLPPADGDETIELDNRDPVVPATAGAVKKRKKFSIPNFERFRLRLFLAIGALILLIVIWLLAAVVLPKANIIVTTDTSTVDSEIAFTANAAAEEFDPAAKTVPAELKQIERTEAEKVPATGEKDVGTKATGTMTVTNCTDDGEERTIPAGTGFSSGQLTFISTKTITLEASVHSGDNCRTDLGETLGFTKDVPVTAQNNGDQYNVSSRSYDAAISGDIRARGSDMSGGTSKIIKVVTDQDVAAARAKIEERASGAAAEEVARELKDAGFFPLAATLTTGEPVVTASPTVGQEAAEVTVTAITTYSMLGVKDENLKTLITEAVKEKIDTDKQTIQDDGLAKATFEQLERPSPEVARLSMKAVTTAGPELDADSLKQEIAGKKRGEVEEILKSRPGISEVDVRYSPFWVLSTPDRAANITIEFKQSNENATGP